MLYEIKVFLYVMVMLKRVEGVGNGALENGEVLECTRVWWECGKTKIGNAR